MSLMDMFKSILLLTVILSCWQLSAGEGPLFRAGIMTDTHISNDPQSCRMVRNAFLLFKRKKVDLVINAGDIAHRHSPAGYRHYRRIFNEVFSAAPPRDVIIYANHDQIGCKNWDDACRELKKHIRASNDPFDMLEIRGYPFLIFPQFFDMEKYRKILDDTVRKYAAVPVFVLDHPPPFDTVAQSRTWGCKKRRNILNQYPSVIHISGHAHGSLHDERLIWQGEFTAVNAGCLSQWGGTLTGHSPVPKESSGVLIMELFKNRVLFRRYDVVTGKEYKPQSVWTIPLPFEKDKAPYRPSARKSAVPSFSAGAELSVTAAAGSDDVKVQFPAASPVDDICICRFVIDEKQGRGWKKTAVSERFSDFYLLPEKRRKIYDFTISSAYFNSGKTSRISVYPVDFSGKTGKPLQKTFKVPSPERWEVVYETRSPMTDCPFYSGARGHERMVERNGFYHKKSWIHRLHFPANIWKAASGTRYRFIVDVKTDSNWVLVLRQMFPKFYPCGRVHTGKSGSHSLRYIMEFTQQENREYCLQVQNSGSGKIRFEYIRIERKK